MSEIRSINESPVTRLSRDSSSAPRRVEVEPTVRRGDDRVEVSDMARLLNRLRGDEFRPDLVSRVKGEIDQGVYESGDKLDVAVEAALDDLNQ